MNRESVDLGLEESLEDGVHFWDLLLGAQDAHWPYYPTIKFWVEKVSLLLLILTLLSIQFEVLSVKLVFILKQFNCFDKIFHEGLTSIVIDCKGV